MLALVGMHHLRKDLKAGPRLGRHLGYKSLDAADANQKLNRGMLGPGQAEVCDQVLTGRCGSYRHGRRIACVTDFSLAKSRFAQIADMLRKAGASDWATASVSRASSDRKRGLHRLCKADAELRLGSRPARTDEQWSGCTGWLLWLDLFDVARTIFSYDTRKPPVNN